MRVWPGHPYPLGATWDGQGVNFAIFSERATGVELCLFDRESDGVESDKVALSERTDHVWHCYLPDVRPGQFYGYRVFGAYDPSSGDRFNSAKLLIDPYAKAVSSAVVWSSALLAYDARHADADLIPDTVNNAGSVPKSVVIDPAFTWEDDRPPRIPWHRTILYECHVKGMTKLHPDVPEPLRGTYLGLCSDAMIEYLLALGITAVELLPVHQAVVDQRLAERGLTNYWGYNTIGFFAPDVRYATKGSGNQVYEFKSMVKTLHSAGIEVILDVVYNHTGEGHHLGPTLSLRGIDNRAYYRLDPDKRFYTDFTGTGNSLNMQHPRTIQLVMDSLRYWVNDMHVDGFRFDLAPVLARELQDWDKLAAFFDIIHQDPTLANVKLIAEPWDVGPGGYQAGNFPIRWAEWNAQYRDAVRRFWRGDRGSVSEMASRLAGSSDMFQWSGRGAYASVNFVAAHDGYTLFDLASYEHKHNEANGEQNRDGHDDNISRNWGVEGTTDDPRVLDARFRVMRDFIATLAFSQGVPMLSHGDEIARTQRGNNNAYAQDNELTWIHWDLDDRRRALLAFTRRCLSLRHMHAVLRRRHFFRGEPTFKDGPKDLSWLRPDGREMTGGDWYDGDRHALGMLLYGDATDETDDRGRLITGETLLLLLNGGDAEVTFTLPAIAGDGIWAQVIDTAEHDLRIVTTGTASIAPYSLVLLRHGDDRRTPNVDLPAPTVSVPNRDVHG
ncbi:MAG TPA: glycogen debranching protein GlgX [Gemmatimonadaceae bacterium]|nr:glycogen debranching protein GlgX [Gemmatimonadaceae bacterium]